MIGEGEEGLGQEGRNFRLAWKGGGEKKGDGLLRSGAQK